MFSGVFIAIFIVILCVFAWYWQNRKVKKLIDKIPGPRALPLIGNIHMLKSDGHEYFQQMLQFSKDYGSKDGIWRIWFGPFPLVLLTKAHTVEVLLSTTKHMTKAAEYYVLEPWLGTGLLTSKGQKWKDRRRLLTPTFHFKILQDFMGVFNHQANVMVKHLKKQVDKKEPFNIFPYITFCALDIICDTAMGINVNAQADADSAYVDAVAKISEDIQNRFKNPLLKNNYIFGLTKTGKRHQKSLEILQEFTRKVIAERSQEFDEQMASHTGKITMEDLQSDNAFRIGKQKHLAFLDMLLVASKSGAGLTHSDIQEEVDTFMFEGHDTTAAAAVWAVYLLGSHPEVQKKAQEELDKIFGASGRDVTLDDIKRMTYLDCVIKETLRVFPSVPFFMRVIEEDCEIGGYTVPKDTSAMIITSALHKDPDHFPDPERFDPDRWMSENSANRHPYCYVPFSAGMRNCIGQRFAMNEEKVMLSALLRHYNITSHQTREELRPVGELIQRPEKGIFVTITERK